MKIKFTHSQLILFFKTFLCFESCLVHASFPSSPRLSITVQNTIPLADVFSALSDMTGVAIQIDPKIECKGLRFAAYERPVLEIIQDLCELNDHMIVSLHRPT